MAEPALEPQALELRRDDDGRIRLSIAISLTRIADALSDGTPLGALADHLEMIATRVDHATHYFGDEKALIRTSDLNAE